MAISWNAHDTNQRALFCFSTMNCISHNPLPGFIMCDQVQLCLFILLSLSYLLSPVSSVIICEILFSHAAILRASSFVMVFIFDVCLCLGVCCCLGCLPCDFDLLPDIWLLFQITQIKLHLDPQPLCQSNAVNLMILSLDLATSPPLLRLFQNPRDKFGYFLSLSRFHDSPNDLYLY